MYGIFMEEWVTFKQVAGNGYLLALFVASMLYLLVAEKDMRKKLVVAVAPLIILVGYFIPFTKIAYVAVFKEDSANTYYRVLWLIPMGAVIAYAGCKLFMEHKRIGLIVVSSLIIICGSLVYKNQYMNKAENAYHIPQIVIDICDEISPEEGEPRVKAIFPGELIHFVRQYDTNILMPYGRDVVHHQYNIDVYKAFEKPEVINAKELLEATRQEQCRYIVMYKDRDIDVKLEDMGLTIVNTVGVYNIYEDPEVIQQP